MAAHSKKHEPEGFVGKHPGIVSALFATAVGVGFILALVNGAGDHGGGHGGGHGAAPSAQHSSAPAAHH